MRVSASLIKGIHFRRIAEASFRFRQGLSQLGYRAVTTNTAIGIGYSVRLMTPTIGCPSVVGRFYNYR